MGRLTLRLNGHNVGHPTMLPPAQVERVQRLLLQLDEAPILRAVADAIAVQA